MHNNLYSVLYPQSIMIRRENSNRLTIIRFYTDRLSILSCYRPTVYDTRNHVDAETYSITAFQFKSVSCFFGAFLKL